VALLPSLTSLPLQGRLINSFLTTTPVPARPPPYLSHQVTFDGSIIDGLDYSDSFGGFALELQQNGVAGVTSGGFVTAAITRSRFVNLYTSAVGYGIMTLSVSFSLAESLFADNTWGIGSALFLGTNIKVGVESCTFLNK
jgi:hypothetical protein